MTVKQNEQQIADLKKRIEALEEDAGSLNYRLDCASGKLYEYMQAVGPMWKTAAGHARPLSMLSTEHLENLVNGRWLEDKCFHKGYAFRELERRKIDTDMRKKPSLWARFWRRNS